MSDFSTGCTFRYLILSLAIIMLSTLLCTLSTIAYIDYNCVHNGERWLPLYPGAQILQENDGYFRRFGFGDTMLVLYTLDDNNTVRKWYMEHSRQARMHYRTSGLAETDWAVILTPGQAGSTIVLTQHCVSH